MLNGNSHVGSGKKLQVGFESVYGTLPTMSLNVNYKSESLKEETTKEALENLMVQKTISGMQVTGRNVSGDIAFDFTPGNIPLAIAALGTEGTVEETAVDSNVFKHPVVLTSPSATLKSLGLIVDRGEKVFGYVGLIPDSLKLDIPSGKGIEGTLSFKGLEEKVTGVTLNGTLPDDATLPFSASDGTFTVKVGATTYTLNEIVSGSISEANGVDDGIQTWGNGKKFVDKRHGLKSYEFTFDAIYTGDTDKIREDLYKPEDVYGELKLIYTSPTLIPGAAVSTPYSFEILAPKVIVTGAEVNVTGKDRIMIKFTAKATCNGGVEPVTATFYTEQETKYLA